MKSKSELELYEFALLEISKKYRQNHPYKKHMMYGLCAYFEHRVGIFNPVKYPVLWSLRPPLKGLQREGGFWFEEGDWGPRIEILEEAIKLLKNE